MYSVSHVHRISQSWTAKSFKKKTKQTERLARATETTEEQEVRFVRQKEQTELGQLRSWLLKPLRSGKLGLPDEKNTEDIARTAKERATETA